MARRRNLHALEYRGHVVGLKHTVRPVESEERVRS